MATDTNAAIASSKAALHSADNFGQRETGNKKAGDNPPKAAAKASDYSHARDARSDSSIGSEAASAAAGLKAKADNIAEYNAAP